MTSKLPDIELLQINATQALTEGDIGRAAEIFGEMTEKYPSDGRGWLGLADIYFTRIGDLEKAELYFKKAIEASSRLVDAYLVYSELLLKLNRFAEMNAVVNKAMEIPGADKGKVHYKAGLLKESQGHYDDAIEAFRSSILSSFSTEEIERSEQAIMRCRVKKKYT